MRKSNLIIKDESARRLRLHILLLEDENDDLHEQLAIEDDRIDSLELEREDLQSRLQSTETEFRRHEKEMCLQARELNNLKVRPLSEYDYSGC